MKLVDVNNDSPLLTVDGLSIELSHGRHSRIVDDVSFEIPNKSIVGIVGESGCGKSVTAHSILGLGSEAIRVAGGRIVFEGQDLLQMSRERLRSIRGARIGAVFQEPMTSLNPLLTVGKQITETLRTHTTVDRKKARLEAISLLELVGIPHASSRVDNYPHELSGGMRQRVAIAIALACKPRLLIADEPTTALDVTIQAQIVDLLKELREVLGMSVLIISHDLELIGEFADLLVVMYAGKVVETGPAEQLLSKPAHPYTRLLLESIPPLGREVYPLPTIPGVVPTPGSMPKGCRFAERCPFALEACGIETPELQDLVEGRRVACIRHAEIQNGATETRYAQSR